MKSIKTRIETNVICDGITTAKKLSEDEIH